MHYKNAKSILSAKNGMNLYRGCTHGCIYCDSRSDCYNFKHEFTDVEVKQNAPQLLSEALTRKREKCMVGMGSMCDPYMPLEKTQLLTRRCAEIVEEMGFGLTLITKSDLVLRDIDLFRSINEKAKCVIQMTLTTFDEELCRIVEPNVATTKKRFEALLALKEAGIPTVVWFTPVLPFINDTAENTEGILSYCQKADVKGVICFGMGVTLRDGDREYFFSKLDEHFPGLKQRYLKAFGLSYMCQSPDNERLMRLFATRCEQYGMLSDAYRIFSYLNEFPNKPKAQQLSFFS